MYIDSKQTVTKGRRNERGMALVTTLLISLLLLAGGGALLLSTGMSANTALDSTAEMQSYYVAEAGLQSTLNVLRGNVKPLVTGTDRMSFRTAIIPDISNGPGNTGALRLAGWLPYNNRTDPGSLVPVSLGTFTGGYKVTVANLDIDSHIVKFETSGYIEGSNVATPSQRTFGTTGGSDEVTIRYEPKAPTTLIPDEMTYPLTSDSDLGNFVIERPATSTADGVAIPKTTFEITISQSKPWVATTILAASIEGVVNVASSTLKVTFEKAAVRADGTNYVLNLGASGQVLDLTYSASPATTNIPARVTSPDPKRLLVKSYGFGPSGSEKRLEMIFTRANLEFEAPGGVTLRGADDCSALNLDSGSSGAKHYSGADYSGVEPTRPAFAVSQCDLDDANAGIKKPGTVSNPKVGVLGVDVNNPGFLDTADKARAFLNGLQTNAQSLGRYFKQTSGNYTVSDSIDSPQFTFVDGDCTLTRGAGFLVVTGTLTMRGNTDFKGAILVLGEGVLVRNGGGNGDILGGITIAKFGRTAGDFLAPTFNTNGGGNSNVQYDSASIKRATGSGYNVSGVREF